AAGTRVEADSFEVVSDPIARADGDAAREIPAGAAVERHTVADIAQWDAVEVRADGIALDGVSARAVGQQDTVDRVAGNDVAVADREQPHGVRRSNMVVRASLHKDPAGLVAQGRISRGVGADGIAIDLDVRGTAGDEHARSPIAGDDITD